MGDSHETSKTLDEVSDAVADVYRSTYDLGRTRVATYMTDDLLICVLEDLALAEQARDPREAARIEDERRAFQESHKSDFCSAVERLTGRRVKTFLSANHVAQGIAAEVFFLVPSP